jgi:aryl-alcohol dehydrogenase-like predicted oxidoreductase
MIQRRLGRDGPLVGAIGLGCMGLSEFYEPVTERDAIATIHRALECGMTMLDTSDMYGRGENERLVGRAVRDRRDQAFVATKGGLLRRPDDPDWRGRNGRPDYLRQACDASLARLGLDVIDLYYLHRVDPDVPIEESVGALAELVAAGKVRYIGLSETDADTLLRASAVAPIAALQSEYSLFTRDVETNGVLAATHELGIAVVAYAPLGRGMLAGAAPLVAGLGSGDVRRRVPRFDPENLEVNAMLVQTLNDLAHSAGLTPAQLALAWVLSRGGDLIALPGCDRPTQVEEDAAVSDHAIGPAVFSALGRRFGPGAAAGSRFRDVLHGPAR